jgi:hypothetical protein
MFAYDMIYYFGNSQLHDHDRSWMDYDRLWSFMMHPDRSKNAVVNVQSSSYNLTIKNVICYFNIMLLWPLTYNQAIINKKNSIGKS